MPARGPSVRALVSASVPSSAAAEASRRPPFVSSGNVGLKFGMLFNCARRSNAERNPALNENAEAVFFEVGDALPKQEFGARKPSRAETIESGRRWLEAKKLEICQLIRSEDVKAVLKGNTPEEEQIRILADLIATHTLGVPPFVLARAVLTLGAYWFCGAPAG